MSDIRFYMTATVDGEEVFAGDYPDTTLLQEEIGKMEDVVAREIDDPDVVDNDTRDENHDKYEDGEEAA
jgi:hypothetical protein